MALMPALGKINEISNPLLKYYFDGRISLIGLNKKLLTQAGLEPTISCSVGRRLIHWATEPSIPFQRTKSIYLYQDHYRLFASETVKMNTDEEIAKPKQKLSFSDLFFIEFIENNLWISCYLNPGFSYFTRTGFKIFLHHQFYTVESTVPFTSRTTLFDSSEVVFIRCLHPLNAIESPLLSGKQNKRRVLCELYCRLFSKPR